jgi:hypothetical protein
VRCQISIKFFRVGDVYTIQEQASGFIMGCNTLKKRQSIADTVGRRGCELGRV